MISSRILHVTVLAISCCLVATSVQAGTLMIDFDGDPTKTPVTMWGYTQFNATAGLSEGPHPDPTNAIVDITKTYADTGYNVDVRVNTNRQKTRPAVTSGDGTAIAMSDLLLDWTGLAVATTGKYPLALATIGLTFDTAGVYDITLYHHETNRSAAAEADMVLTDADGARGSQHILAGYGASPASAPTIETYTVLSDGVNEITLVYAQDPTNNTYAFPLNGLEIGATVVPEPSTLVLSVLGALALVLYGRRKR